MVRITLRIEEDLLARSQELASQRGITLNQLVVELLREVAKNPGVDYFMEMVRLSEELALMSSDGPMTRNEAHRRA